MVTTIVVESTAASSSSSQALTNGLVIRATSDLDKTNIKAAILPASTLPRVPISAVCADYVGGFCRRGDSCLKNHDICDVTEFQDEPLVLGNQNFLSPSPRLLPLDKRVFEDDGPGSLSNKGVRHDNDYIDIRDIKILPTTDEILSRRPPYMPRKDDNSQHHCVPGQGRIMDVNFRHLRYESTEALIDACYHASQFLARSTFGSSKPQYDDRAQTPQGVQYYLYRNINFESLRFQEREGIHVRVSFSCPEALRSRLIIKSGRLESGMLVALIGLDHARNLSTTFMIVDLCQSTDAMKPITGNHLRASVLLKLADQSDLTAVRRILYNKAGLLSETFVLVEFPGALLAGFFPILKQLQILSSGDDKIAFASAIAPALAGCSPTVNLPSYTTIDNFEYRLNVLQNTGQHDESKPLSLKPTVLADDPERQKAFVDTLGLRTTLDNGQATALCENLCRGLAFTQGPPGTGKTFLGVSLSRVILASRRGSPKPILACCTTNHALDSFLADLLKAGITKVARLGRGSKEDWTRPYELRHLSRQMKSTVLESSKIRYGYLQAEGLAKEGHSFCESLNSQSISWIAVRRHLQANYKSVFDRFAGLETFNDACLSDIRLARKAGGFAFEYWCTGGDITDVERLLGCFDTMLGNNDRSDGQEASDARERVLATITRNARNPHVSIISGRDIWDLNMEERKTLLQKWQDEIAPFAIVDQTVEIHRRHLVAILARKQVQQEIDSKCLAQQEVIGLTTNACARNWSMLKQIGLQTVICEEAGEVMEAQTLCTLFPSIEHAIFIGDPLQLRPQINQQTLSLETTNGAAYRLDESLFERMMFPSTPGVTPLPTSQLTLQRRMHPEIADVMRATLYPFLEDHALTFQHPAVAGMVDRLWWFDHQQLEDRSDPLSPMSKSYSNSFEVEMIYGLVSYIINTNEYNFGDIAILTPYNGQLAALTKRLSGACSILLSDKDKENLLDLGLLSVEEAKQGSRTDFDISTMLRLATIDNFQGEEARIVILSTVRSNSEDRVGFMKTENRINVACSRAREGFYLVGNASLMKGVKMWRSIIEALVQKKKIGPNFKTCCSRHPDKTYDVQDPDDFERIPTCQVICGLRLPCGHICKEKCHPPSLHSRMRCTRPCRKHHEQCGHQCMKSCGEPCQECTLELDLTILGCGHKHPVTCTDVQTKSQLEQERVCKVIVDSVQLPCGHHRNQICSSRDIPLVCEDICGAVLDCGHLCTGLCSDCRKNWHHRTCTSACGKEQSCGHACAAPCHPGNCPPCLLPCKKFCPHGQCSQVCSRICDPCIKISSLECEHGVTSTALCGLPYARIPCNERCNHPLPCGHLCSSICGERCSTECVQCTTGKIPEKPIVILSCGHSFDVDTLDFHVGAAKLFKIDTASVIQRPYLRTMQDFPTMICCPTCSAPCDDIQRYALCKQFRDIPESTDRLYKTLGQKMNGFMEQILDAKEDLRSSSADFQKTLKPGPLTGRTNEHLVRLRGTVMMGVQQQITDYRDSVVVKIEEEISKLATFLDIPGILPTCNLPFKIRFDLLYFCCRLITLEESVQMIDLLGEMKDTSQHMTALIEGLRMLTITQATENMIAIQSCIGQCEAKHLKRLEVELRLILVSFHLVLGSLGSNSNVEIDACLQRILSLCSQYPDTAGLFMNAYKSTHSAVKEEHKCNGLYTKETGDFLQKWEDYILGSLKYCGHGHPYSGASFVECPECGKTACDLEKERKDYGSFLHEDAFMKQLQMMKIRDRSGSEGKGKLGYSKSSESSISSMDWSSKDWLSNLTLDKTAEQQTCDVVVALA